MKQLIYLAGSIYDIKPHTQWKKEFIETLDPEFFYTYDPDPVNESLYFDTVARDKQIISKCDILVAYISNITIGTTMEIFYAYQFGNKPVYIIDRTKDNRSSYDLWLKYHCHVSFRDPISCSIHINENMKKYT